MAGISLLAVILLLLTMTSDTLASDRSNAARLSQVIDETFVLAEGDTEWSYAEPNLTLEKGDLLQTNETGMAEIQFKSALTLRVGENSRIAMIETDGETVVGIERGRAYIRAPKDVSRGEALTLTFPSGELLVDEKTLARVDVFEGGNAELKVIRGEIRLDPASEGAGSVEEGERVFITPDGFTKYEPLELTKKDNFDYWNEDRDVILSKYHRSEYIDEEIIGSEDLEDYGEWVYVNRYKTHGWRPHVVSVWRPYYYGRWYYSRCHGWMWIPEEPWGYVTHHYGTWDYDPLYGWIWIPGYYWRPAYVRWVEYDDYIGWVPIGYYGYPVVTIYPYYVSGMYIDFYDTFSFTFVFRNHFHYYHHHHRHHEHGHDYDHDRDGKHRRDRYYEARVRDRDLPSDRIRKVDVIDYTGEPGKIRKGRVRFLDGKDKLDVQRDPHKGVTVRERFNHENVLDIENHPKLERRIARLNEMEKRYQKPHVSTPTGVLPKREMHDVTKTFDFRGPARKHKADDVEKNERVRTQPKPVIRERKVNVPEQNRDRIELKPQDRRIPERRPVQEKDSDKQTVTDDAQIRKADRWDISNVRPRDGKTRPIQERAPERISPRQKDDRIETETRTGVREGVRRIDRGWQTDKPAPPAEVIGSESSGPTRRVVTDAYREEPQRKPFEDNEQAPGEIDRRISSDRPVDFRERTSNSRLERNSGRSSGRYR